MIVVAALLGGPVASRAEPVDADPALHSQIGWGASVNPARLGLTTEGGWNGGDRRAVVAATVEATVVARLSVLATATYGGITDHARPALGLAYQLLDPRDGGTGARLTLTYKPEGFTEPDGEIESVLVLSRRLGGGVLRGMVAYGQDADRNESDLEGGASLVQRVAPDVVVGGTFRYRRGLVIKPGEPSWDVLGGAIGGLAFGRSRIELMLGADGIRYATAQWGIVGLVSLGTEL